VIVAVCALLLALAPVARADFCVLRASDPIWGKKHWVERAVGGGAAAYGLQNLTLSSGRCTPLLPAVDHLGRAGWRRVECAVVVKGSTGSDCAVRDEYPRLGRCTGTVWQTDALGYDIHDLHAARLRFDVLLLVSQTTCRVHARAWQRTPPGPTLQRPGRLATGGGGTPPPR
jgi:hypothetical protein